MGGKNQILFLAKRMSLWQGFLFIDIQSGCGYFSRPQSFQQSIFINDSSSCTIKDPNAILHFCKGIGVYHSKSLIRKRHVNGYVIGFSKSLLQLHFIQVHLLGSVIGQVRIISNHPHFKSPGPFGHLRPYSSKSEDCQGFSAKLSSFQLLAFPQTFPHPACSPDDRTCTAQHMGKSQFCSGNCVTPRGVHHNNSLLRRSLKINVINSHTGPSNNFKIFRSLNHFWCYLGVTPDNDGS